VNMLMLAAVLLAFQQPAPPTRLDFRVTGMAEPSGVEDYLGMDVGIREIPDTIEEYKMLVCRIRQISLSGSTATKSKPADYGHLRIDLHLGFEPIKDGPWFPPEEQTIQLGFFAQIDPKKGTISIFWLKGRHLPRPEDYSFEPDAACDENGAGKRPGENR